MQAEDNKNGEWQREQSSCKAQDYPNACKKKPLVQKANQEIS